MQHHHVARGPQACLFVSRTGRILFLFLFDFSFPFLLVFLVSPPSERVKCRPDHERLEHRLTLTLNGDWLHKHRTNEDCVDSVLYYKCLCEEAFRLPSCVGPWSTLSKSAWFLNEEPVLLRWRKEYSFCPSTRTAAALHLPLSQLLHQDHWRQPDGNINLTIRRDFKWTTRGPPEPLDLDSSLCSRSPQIITSFMVF